MLHVWNIYLHLGKFRINVGKYSIHGASGIYYSLYYIIYIIRGKDSLRNLRLQALFDSPTPFGSGCPSRRESGYVLQCLMLLEASLLNFGCL